MLTEILVVEYIRHTTRVIFTVKIRIFERSNEKNHFSKTKIYFHKETTPQLLERIGLQNMKVGKKTNCRRLTKYFKFVRWMLTSSQVFTTVKLSCLILQ